MFIDKINSIERDIEEYRDPETGWINEGNIPDDLLNDVREQEGRIQALNNFLQSYDEETGEFDLGIENNNNFNNNINGYFPNSP